MAAAAAPYGARPIGSLSANGSWTGKTRMIPIATTYGTAIFAGDFVKIVGATGTVALDAGTATGTPVGIFMGCSYTDPTTGQYRQDVQWPASNAATDAVAYVLDDPDVVFEMQGDGTLAQGALGSNVGWANTAGNTSFGRSKNAIDVSDEATTNTLPGRVIGFVDRPDSVVGDAFTDAILIFIVGHAYRTLTGV